MSLIAVRIDYFSELLRPFCFVTRHAFFGPLFRLYLFGGQYSWLFLSPCQCPAWVEPVLFPH